MTRLALIWRRIRWLFEDLTGRAAYDGPGMFELRFSVCCGYAAMYAGIPIEAQSESALREELRRKGGKTMLVERNYLAGGCEDFVLIRRSSDLAGKWRI